MTRTSSAQRLVAVKTLAHLASEVVEGEPEGAGRRFELELHLQLALLEAVSDIAGARVLGDFALQAIDG